jgi:hypothetical protein
MVLNWLEYLYFFLSFQSSFSLCGCGGPENTAPKVVSGVVISPCLFLEEELGCHPPHRASFILSCFTFSGLFVLFYNVDVPYPKLVVNL